MRTPRAKQCDGSGREHSAASSRSWAAGRSLTALLLGCALMLALGAAQAQAAPKSVVDLFDSAGTGVMEFNTPRGLAVRNSNGHVYVVDSGNHRIQEFGPLGFERAWGWAVKTTPTPENPAAFEVCSTPGPCRAGVAGSGAGQFNSPQGIAVDQVEDGPVYVTDQGNRRVQKFDHEGNFLQAFGALGTLGGQFGGTFSGHVAVNPVNHNVVVADPGNRRVQEFTSSGAFVRAWGFDVIQRGKSGNVPVNEQQVVTVVATGGTFRLRLSGVTTQVDGIPFDASAATVQNQLEGLSNIGPGNVEVSGDAGGPWTVEFKGALADTDMLQMTALATDLDGSVTVATSIQGAHSFEVCVVAADCKAGAASGSGAGQFATDQPRRVAVDSSGAVYTVESTGNWRVQKFNPSVTAGGVFAATQASGTSDATAPSDVAVDPTNDNVLVTKADNSTGVTERRVLEFNLGGSLVDTHAAGAGLPTANGMALRSAGGPVYLSAGTTTDPRVFVLGAPTPPPSATMDPVAEDDITATSAKLNGTVNPNGGGLITRYRFEYSDDRGITWARVPATDVDVGDDTDPHQVTQTAEGLEPNTEYRARLVASRPFAGGSATSAEETFTTDAAPPTISGVAVREVTDTTAVLVGRIDANHSHTTYRFEYGTDTGYGTTTAVDNAGSGAAEVPVSKAIAGLQPNTTYHFRLVATNSAGEAQGTDQTFTTAANPPQPSGRAYEMVSPLDKNGGDIDRDVLTVLNSQSGAAASGDAVAFLSRVAFADIESGALNPNYVARRGPVGWTTEGITPPISNLPTGSDRPRIFGLSHDVSKAYVRTGVELTEDAARLNGSWGLYTRTSGQAEPYKLLSSPDPSLTLSQDTVSLGQDRFTYVADTPDSRHVIFHSGRQLLPNPDPPGSGPPIPPDSSSPNAVYEWVDGTLRLASVLPDGLTATDVMAGRLSGGGEGNDVQLRGDHVISDDGGRVFFTARLSAAQGGVQLFARENGVSTARVSASEFPGNPFVGGAVPEFYAAKADDGSVAFFRATAALTPNAGSNSLYRWDANPSAGQPRLMALSPGVVGPAAISDDARSVYFVSDAQAPKLSLWRQGEGVRDIANLDASLDRMMWTLEFGGGGRAVRVSADGERLLFASYADLPGDAYDTTEATAEACGDPDVPGQACRQIYLYDGRSGETSCVTCVPGVPVTGDVNLFGNGDGRRPAQGGRSTLNAPVRLPRNLSADGTRAFFETARPLVSADQNSQLDVYEWVDADLDGQGDLRLISPGRGTTDSKFLDASLSGDNVFFTTREQLVGIDRDNQVDLYDARVGGGIPAQNPPPATQCAGDECQGALSGAPFLVGVGSSASHGDLRPRPRPSFSVARLSRKQRAELARGRRVVVRVRVNRGGMVRLSARAKLGKRMRTVDRASKRARRAGTVGVGVKLSRSAVRELGRDGTLTVRLAVRFAGVREARTSMLRLRREQSSGERGAR